MRLPALSRGLRRSSTTLPHDGQIRPSNGCYGTCSATQPCLGSNCKCVNGQCQRATLAIFCVPIWAVEDHESALRAVFPI